MCFYNAFLYAYLTLTTCSAGDVISLFTWHLIFYGFS